MLQPPTLEQLRSLSDDYNLNATEEELNIFTGLIAHDMEGLKLLNAWENPLHLEQPKYEGRQIHRAKPEENRYNAWYQKCLISGNQEPSKLLSGYKVAIKDNIAIGTSPMMNGSRVLEGYTPEYDATVVARILNHGGLIVGSTTCENLCLSGASYNTTYGPVRNPWNPAHSAGGSSSGSAVVVASGEADVSLGCDQGGSIRIPASNCGLVGFKPTFGLVPYTGIVSIDFTLDHVGPMARTVTDCARLLSAIAGHDEGKDFRQPSCGFRAPDYLAEVASAKAGTLRIGVLQEGFNECDEVVKKCINHAVDLIKASDKFSKVAAVSIPDHDKAMVPYAIVLFYGTQNQLIDGCGYGTGNAGVLSSSLPSKLYHGLKSEAHTLHELGKEIILSTAYVKKHGGDTFYASYAKAQTWGWVLTKEYDRALADVDVLLMPTLPKLPAKIPTEDTPLIEKMVGSVNMIKNTAPFDLTHHPAITLNAGYDEEMRLPIGLQLVGRLWDDATVLKAAKLVEEVLASCQKPFPY